MTNRKTTRRALVLSLLALLVCCSMLVGTTFAWFTDSVQSATNKIVAGNLDVELEYWNGTKWEQVTAETNVFEKNTLWEPGHTEIVYLKVSNLGTLALKYKLGINIASETGSVNVKDEAFKLSDYIQVGIIKGLDENNRFGSREAARAAQFEQDKLIKEGYVTESQLYPTNNVPAAGGNTAEYVAMVVYMPETVGNEANYKKGANEPTILLGLDLLATQLTYEDDSFNNQYDKDAEFVVEVKNADELANALNAGGLVKLANDISVEDALTVPAGVAVELDLNGKSITGGYQSGSTTKHVYAIENKGSLTLKNGTVNARGVDNYGTLIVEDGVYNAVDTDGGAAIWNHAGSYATINGGTFTAAQTTAAPAATVMQVASGATVVVNGGTFKSDADLTYAIISNGDLTINDANVSGEHGTIAAEAGTLTINGGTYEITASGHVIYSKGATITLNGGSFKHSQIGASAEGNVVLYASGSAKATVNGGSYDSVEGAFAYSSMIGNITINGGTFLNKAATVYSGNLDAFVATTSTATANADGSITVTPWKLSSVNELAEAIANGKTAVSISSGITLNAQLEVNGELTIYGNGNTIIATEKESATAPADQWPATQAHIIDDATGTTINWNNCTFIKNGVEVSAPESIN